jgi:hypothetical protein
MTKHRSILGLQISLREVVLIVALMAFLAFAVKQRFTESHLSQFSVDVWQIESELRKFDRRCRFTINEGNGYRNLSKEIYFFRVPSEILEECFPIVTSAISKQVASEGWTSQSLRKRSGFLHLRIQKQTEIKEIILVDVSSDDKESQTIATFDILIVCW